MDAPPVTMQPCQITTLYSIYSKHKILISEGRSSTLGNCFTVYNIYHTKFVWQFYNVHFIKTFKDKTELTLFSSLCFGCVSRDLNYFAYGLPLNKIPRSDIPRKIATRISKCQLNERQKIIYHSFLDKSMSDLDSMDVSRVFPCISSLLRICNHADFRPIKEQAFSQAKLENNYVSIDSIHQNCFFLIKWILFFDFLEIIYRLTMKF